MAPTKVILLAALEEPCPPLRLADGRDVVIRQVDGVGMQLLQSAQAGEALLFWEVAARCLPGLTTDEVFTFTLAQVRQIVEVACGAAQRVLDALGEDGAPTEMSPPAPSSTIPSGT